MGEDYFGKDSVVFDRGAEALIFEHCDIQRIG